MYEHSTKSSITYNITYIERVYIVQKHFYPAFYLLKTTLKEQYLEQNLLCLFATIFIEEVIVLQCSLKSWQNQTT